MVHQNAREIERIDIKSAWDKLKTCILTPLDVELLDAWSPISIVCMKKRVVPFFEAPSKPVRDVSAAS